MYNQNLLRDNMRLLSDLGTGYILSFEVPVRNYTTVSTYIDLLK